MVKIEIHAGKANANLRRSILFILYHITVLVIGCAMLVNGVYYTVLFNRSYIPLAHQMDEVVGSVFLGILGGLFTLLSISSLSLAFKIGKKSKREDYRRNENPTKPWLWKEEWLDRKIPSSGPKFVFIMAGMGIICSVFGFGLILGFIYQHDASATVLCTKDISWSQ
ncbi:MAG: hypothetical protein VCD00_05460 [Candidatus Hydrogenedentota bacterium]